MLKNFMEGVLCPQYMLLILILSGHETPVLKSTVSTSCSINLGGWDIDANSHNHQTSKSTKDYSPCHGAGLRPLHLLYKPGMQTQDPHPCTPKTKDYIVQLHFSPPDSSPTTLWQIGNLVAKL